jgi:hypothetical protein
MSEHRAASICTITPVLVDGGIGFGADQTLHKPFINELNSPLGTESELLV